MIDNIKQLPKRPKTFEEYNKERITDETKLKEQNIRLQQIEAENALLRANKANEQAGLLNTIAVNIELLKNVQKNDSVKINNVHARLNNDLSEKKKPLTKKQREEAEIEEMRQNAHNRLRMNGYKR